METPFMTRKIVLLLLAATLPFAGCDKIKALIHRQKLGAATPVPAVVAAVARIRTPPATTVASTSTKLSGSG